MYESSLISWRIDTVDEIQRYNLKLIIFEKVLTVPCLKFVQ